jgi:preprotein translocase subunit SecD
MILHFSRLKIISILCVCAISVVLSLPTLLPAPAREHLPEFLRDVRVNLGLDLQGGSHLLLKVDFEAFQKEFMSNLVDDIRTKLRAEKVGYKGLASRDGKVVFSLRDPQGLDIEKIIHQVDRDLDVVEQGGEYSVSLSETALKLRKQQVLEQSIQIVDRRVNETGTREPIIQRQGDDRILVQVPGLQDPEHLKGLLGRTAKLTFHLLDHSVSPSDIAAGVVPPGTKLVAGDDSEKDAQGKPQMYPVLSRVMVAGDALVEAHATFDQTDNLPVVAFRFNQAGASKFATVTSENVGKPFAVVLDNKVITAPVIRSPILGGSGIISGNFTAESANDLALLLRAGALPAPLQVIEERTVGPSLGSDSVASGTKACLIGVGFVMAFMIINYGLFGFFANVALVVNGLLIFALMAMFKATLTMPGIAGIVLTLGMAVDTNVLIYERLREEIRAGKSPFPAVESAFKMAFGTIIDSHITTFSAAILLFIFGTGTVKGFAVTLSVGIAASLFTAVLVTRLMIVTWLKRTRPKAIPI